MTNKDREDMIQRAISEYKTCKAEELRHILLTENDKW